VDEKLDAEAEALLSALEAGELSGAERAEAEALVARSPAARATLERLARLRALTSALPDPSLSSAARRRVGDAVVAALDAGRRRRRLWTTAAATLTLAAAAALFVSWAPWRPAPAPAVAEREVRTGPGEHRLLQVGDRATAFVSERSIVRLALPGESGPPLRIVSGRVRFVVRPDKDHPWTVATPAADATVHGTEFDVDVSDDATDVRVARGEVEVHNALGARTLWAGEVARTKVGGAPRRIERIVPVVLEGMPEIEERPKR
jgi:ferric-dicitrate binding protein FerR (iron transport regulator)